VGIAEGICCNPFRRHFDCLKQVNTSLPSVKAGASLNIKMKSMNSGSGHWSSRAIRNKDVLGIMEKTLKKRKTCVKRGIYDLRVEAMLKSTEIAAIAQMYLPIQDNSDAELPFSEQVKENNPIDEDDPFELDKVFASLDHSFKTFTNLR